MDIKDILFALSGACAVGNVSEAADRAYEMLSAYADCERKDNLTVIGTIKGKSDKTLMLDAHIDEVAMVVTDVDENGFLSVAKAGGIDLRNLPARVVTVHGKKPIPAVFCSTPPHLAGGEVLYEDIADQKLDTGLSGAAAEIVSVGDYVTFRMTPAVLSGSIVTGKSFDDRAGVTCLIELARRLSGKELPMNVSFVLSDAEELGMRGSITSAYEVNPNEAIAIDVSFGVCPDVSKGEGGVLSKGAMIGISPALDSKISQRLIEIAKEKDISYQTEVMGGRTGTDSDVISVTRAGVRTGLVSIPIRNMHTDTEVIDICDIESVCDILEEYILGGGICCD